MAGTAGDPGLFSTAGFMPHIHCYLGRAPLVWTMVVTDLLIGLAYVSISITLYLLIRRIRMPFHGVFIAFGLFIFACGGTHFMEVYNLWVPEYWLAAGLKTLTAGASIATAVSLFPLKSKVVRFAESARQAEESALQLRRSQQFLNSLIEYLPNMVFVKSAHDLRFVRLNKAGEELLGHSREELVGKNDYDFFTREQADFFTSKDRAVLSGNAIVEIPEEEIRTREHGVRILHTKKIPIFDAEGRPEYLLGISEDITDQIRAREDRLRMIREQAAIEERERESARVELLSDITSILSSSLDYRDTLRRLTRILVPAYCDACTISVQRAEGEYERVAVAHRDPAKTPWLERMDARVSAREVVAPVLSGKTRIFESIADANFGVGPTGDDYAEISRQIGAKSFLVAPIATGGKVLGAISLVSCEESHRWGPSDQRFGEEIGRRAALAIENALLYETAQSAIRVRDEFLSIASHELKTPITSLKLQLQFARRNTDVERGLAPPVEKLARTLDVATAQVNRLSALIEDLLDVSRIGAGKLRFKFEPMDLVELLREMLDRYAEPLRAAGCDVSLDLPATLRIDGDRFRLEQVIINLLSNAAKYGAAKPIEVALREDGGRVQILVRDEGMGIPENKLDRVFERFERAIAPDNISGLGLGLYITREIVQAHAGTVRVESVLGKGSTFIVDLPKSHSA